MSNLQGSAIMRYRMGAIVAVLLAVAELIQPGGIVRAADLDQRPIGVEPEPLGRLHPSLDWMARHKIRAIWIGDDLFATSAEANKTKGQVVADAGFNLACVGMTVNTNGEPSGVVDATKPQKPEHDRRQSTDLEARLKPNVEEARRDGLALMIVWKYGSHHLEPYRKYRSPKGALAKTTCCPLDETYIGGQHVGKWAAQIAKGGADGMVIDMEMYQSDTSWPEGPCMCDDCFNTYLKAFAANPQALYDGVPAEGRGAWLQSQKAEEHYAAFAAQRTEALYDSIRRRCQEINPAFFFGVAPQLHHFPGVERGLGTASVPCLVFSEHEYTHGAYRGSFLSVKDIRQNLPALFLCGAYVAVQPPDMLANNAIHSSLYCDGWWAWYGTALLTDTAAGQSPPPPYGRFGKTSARDYLDRITAAHGELDKLLKLPQDQWPPRQDQRLPWLKAQVAEAKARADAEKSPDAQKALAEAQAELQKYETLSRAGGY